MGKIQVKVLLNNNMVRLTEQFLTEEPLIDWFKQLGYGYKKDKKLIKNKFMDKELFHRIKKWKDESIRKEGKIDAEILIDEEIEKICMVLPRTKKELLKCLSVHKKISRDQWFDLYGKRIFEIIEEYYRDK